MVSRNPPRPGTGEAQDSSKVSNENVPGGSSSGEQPKRLLQGFQDATTDYAAALMQISSRLQEKLQAAVDDLTHRASPAASQSATEELNSAYRDLLSAYQNQDWEKIKSIQTAYLSRVQAQYADAEAAARDQLGGYANAVQAAWQDAKSDALTAFQKHVGAAKDSFAALSVENADPATLAMIAQGMAVVASHAHGAAQAAAAGGAQPKA